MSSQKLHSSGITFLDGGEEGEYFKIAIHTTIFRDALRAFVMDCGESTDIADVYTVRLILEAGGKYHGTWSQADGTKGECHCERYSNGTRQLLVGTWRENNVTYRWFTELST